MTLQVRLNKVIGLYYKQIMIMLQIVASLSDDSREIIYDHNMFKVQATPSSYLY